MSGRHGPVTSRRDRMRGRRRSRRLAILLLAALTAVPTGLLTSPAFGRDATVGPVADTPGVTVSASRDLVRVPSGSWSMDTVDADRLTRRMAGNPRVARLMSERDADALPAGFNPDHETGDTGPAYAFSQCTWWAYTRRHQLGLPVGSHLGDGAMWADSARRLGYWVDDTPRVGDVMVFRRGQEGASAVYGHVAIVEKINGDGSVTTSECGATYHGRPFTRTFHNVHDFQYIHY